MSMGDLPEEQAREYWGDRDAASSDDVTVQQALNRVGRRLNRYDVGALEELDAAFREWADDHGMWWDDDLRLAKAIAAVIHVELTFDDGLSRRV